MCENKFVDWGNNICKALNVGISYLALYIFRLLFLLLLSHNFEDFYKAGI